MIPRRQLLSLAAVTALFLVMAASFVGMPWPTEQHEIPVYDNSTRNATGNGIANSLFGSYPIALILVALILGAAMIGGVYLAKMEGGRLGP